MLCIPLFARDTSQREAHDASGNVMVSESSPQNKTKQTELLLLPRQCLPRAEPCESHTNHCSEPFIHPCVVCICTYSTVQSETAYVGQRAAEECRIWLPLLRQTLVCLRAVGGGKPPAHRASEPISIYDICAYLDIQYTCHVDDTYDMEHRSNSRWFLQNLIPNANDVYR